MVSVCKNKLFNANLKRIDLCKIVQINKYIDKQMELGKCKRKYHFFEYKCE